MKARTKARAAEPNESNAGTASGVNPRPTRAAGLLAPLMLALPARSRVPSGQGESGAREAVFRVEYPGSDDVQDVHLLRDVVGQLGEW